MVFFSKYDARYKKCQQSGNNYTQAGNHADPSGQRGLPESSANPAILEFGAGNQNLAIYVPLLWFVPPGAMKVRLSRRPKAGCALHQDTGLK
ncbi:MAG: hypothetical protein DMG65_04890 [Candidatus Angelobacter sp. Gp1-AA117]|nr:MAG: hypothetical protein DMG65_04890 [Candidatus Angelobacter sp. Gp1-AA117]